jgi:hypothetical protein
MTISRREDGTQGFRQVCGLFPTTTKKVKRRRRGSWCICNPVIPALQTLKKEDQAFKVAAATH